jgi:hypothetical protein
MYHGVFAPNHPLRPAVTSLAVGNLGQLGDAASSPPLPPGEGRGEGAGGSDGVFRCDIRGTLTRPAATLSQRERGIASCAPHLPCSISLWQLLRVQCPFHFPSPIGALVLFHHVTRPSLISRLNPWESRRRPGARAGGARRGRCHP